MTIGGGKKQRLDMTVCGNVMTTESVPEEIVEEVLSKLPVKSLCRFRFDWGDDHFIIYNPSTRESRILPGFELTASFGFYGFGYAESIDDYKLIKIICEQRKVHIFSLKNNNWTIVSDYDCPYPYCLAVYDDWGYSSLPLCNNTGGTSLNGAIHWVLAHEDVNKYILSAFDLVQDKFKILPTPSDLLIDRYCTIEVGDLGGCLALMCVLRDSTTYTSEFWVMKEYGAGESWTRILTTNFETSIVTLQSIKNPPLCFWWKNNENNRQMVLFDNWRKLILYDADDEAYKHLMNIPANRCYNDRIKEAGLYVESLVSPNYVSQ